MAPESDPGLRWKQYMLQGQFERAWELSDLVPDRCKSAGDFRGKRVLVRCEHGLGDTIQFIRYLYLLRPIARRLLVHVQPRLLPLVRTIGAVDMAFSWEDKWPRGEYDCEIEVMDLPHVFRTTLETVPRNVPYLSVDGALVQAQRPVFRREGLLNVGLVWSAGNWDSRR